MRRNIHLFFKVLNQQGLAGALRTVMRKLGEKAFLKMAVPRVLTSVHDNAILNEVFVFENAQWYREISKTFPPHLKFGVIVVVEESEIRYFHRALTKIFAQIFQPTEIYIWVATSIRSKASQIFQTMEPCNFQGHIVWSDGEQPFPAWIRQTRNQSKVDFFVLQRASDELTLDSLFRLAIAVHSKPESEALSAKTVQISEDSLLFSESHRLAQIKSREKLLVAMEPVPIDAVAMYVRSQEAWDATDLSEPRVRETSNHINFEKR